MDQKELDNLRSRTDAKIRYAQVHLEELKEKGILGGDDFDRAHQESFLYHLLGAKETFLIELNVYYSGGLANKYLTAGKLRDALKVKGIVSNELVELYLLERDENSWLFHAKEMRDYSTHVSYVKRKYHLGGQADRQVWLRNPKTDKNVERHFVDEFEDWLVSMKEMLERLRNSARNQIDNS
ncbi:MAG TPA: hypothetical protein VJ987_07795 [Anaerolineales bacterium]|nr:hypothetical protein [Anaerolineales bacterium]